MAVRRLDLETECELLWIELLPHSYTKLLFGVFNHPPSFIPSYLAKLEDSLASISESYKIILCGNFNAPLVDWSTMESSRVASDLCEIIQDFSLHQLVYNPT